MELQKQLYTKLEKVHAFLSDKNMLNDLHVELLSLKNKSNSLNDFMELRKIAYRILEIEKSIHQITDVEKNYFIVE